MTRRAPMTADRDGKIRDWLEGADRGFRAALARPRGAGFRDAADWAVRVICLVEPLDYEQREAVRREIAREISPAVAAKIAEHNGTPFRDQGLRLLARALLKSWDLAIEDRLKGEGPVTPTEDDMASSSRLGGVLSGGPSLSFGPPGPTPTPSLRASPSLAAAPLKSMDVPEIPHLPEATAQEEITA